MSHYRRGYYRQAHTRIVNGKVQHVRGHYVTGHTVNTSPRGSDYVFTYTSRGLSSSFGKRSSRLSTDLQVSTDSHLPTDSHVSTGSYVTNGSHTSSSLSVSSNSHASTDLPILTDSDNVTAVNPASQIPSTGCLIVMAVFLSLPILFIGGIGFFPFGIGIGVAAGLPMLQALTTINGKPIGAGLIACTLITGFALFMYRDFLSDIPLLYMSALFSYIIMAIDYALRRHYDKLHAKQSSDDNTETDIEQEQTN